MNELYHYGVKGQKWGVRRYQNKDGSLTSAGKKRVANTVIAEHRLFADRYGFKQKESTAHRRALPRDATGLEEAIERERTKLLSDRRILKKAGYIFKDNPDSDEREHNADLLDYVLKQQPGVKEAKRKYAEWYLETRSDATLADLSLKKTEQAKTFVKECLTEEVFSLSSYLKGDG